MRRRKSSSGKPREKRTLIPSFDPVELAKEIEQESSRATSPPPFDPMAYARIVDEGSLDSSGALLPDGPPLLRDSSQVPTKTFHRVPEAMPRTISDTPPAFGAPRRVVPAAPGAEDPTLEADETDETETIGREMYGAYLASDFPGALALAERLLDQRPEHSLAQLVAQQCRERLPRAGTSTLRPSSVLRLKFRELERQASHIDAAASVVLGHVDGVSDAATVAALTGLPNTEALNRLHALLDLGVLEVVSF